MRFPQAIQNLIDDLSEIPTVGPKTAQRYVFYLLKQPKEFLTRVAADILNLKKNLKICNSCLAVAETDPCPICADRNRDAATLCVIATQPEMLALESTNKYHGLYFLLGRNLRPQEGVSVEKTNIAKLEARLRQGKVKEIILALSPTLEGETTSLYLAKILKPLKIKITRLARGLPMGSDIEYADEITLNNALKNRNEILNQ
ncbi:MAG TPA: recombination mediator RecR [Candidatus Methylomirabilis sp.]|nr:recombination mediator RecR [Candidatus Methylomirabilis sp.]